MVALAPLDRHQVRDGVSELAARQRAAEGRGGGRDRTQSRHPGLAGAGPAGLARSGGGGGKGGPGLITARSGCPRGGAAVRFDKYGRWRWRSWPCRRSSNPDPVGDAAGPSTPALLASALGHCLSASLLDALKHARVEVFGYETEALAVVKPNTEGKPRH